MSHTQDFKKAATPMMFYKKNLWRKGKRVCEVCNRLVPVGTAA